MKDYWTEINRFLGRFLTPAVRAIFLVNVGLFVLGLLLMPFQRPYDAYYFYLIQVPQHAVLRGWIWQLATYMFMHGGAMHLIGNAFVLWFFAPRLETRWGTARFLRFYFIVGVGAGLFHTVSALATGRVGAGLLGASGATYGIMLAYALYYPNDTVLLWFTVPIKIKYLMVIMVVSVFVLSSSDPFASEISHLTHLGGLVIAFVYVKGKDWFGGRGGRSGGGRRRGKKPVVFMEVDPSRHPDFR